MTWGEVTVAAGASDTHVLETVHVMSGCHGACRPFSTVEWVCVVDSPFPGDKEERQLPSQLRALTPSCMAWEGGEERRGCRPQALLVGPSEEGTGSGSRESDKCCNY